MTLVLWTWRDHKWLLKHMRLRAIGLMLRDMYSAAACELARKE